LICLLFIFACSAESVFLMAPNMVLEFVDGRPSFVLQPTNSSSFYISFTFQSISEQTPGGSVVKNYVLPNTFSIERHSLSYNLTTVQNLTFLANLPNQAHVTFSYVLVNTLSDEPQSVFIDTLPFTVYQDLPLCYFDVSLENWNFQDKSNRISTKATVVANIGALSVGYSESIDDYFISMPYQFHETVSTTLYKTALVDSVPVSISSSFSINSISQPISADVYLSFPFFNSSLEYYAFVQISTSTFKVTLLSIIVTVSLVIGFCIIFGIILGVAMCYLKKYQKKPEVVNDNVPQTEEEKEKSPSKPQKKPMKYFHPITSTVSIGNVFRMKM